MSGVLYALCIAYACLIVGSILLEKFNGIIGNPGNANVIRTEETAKKSSKT